MNTILGIGAELNWNLSLWHFQKKTLIDPFEYGFLKLNTVQLLKSSLNETWNTTKTRFKLCITFQLHLYRENKEQGLPLLPPHSRHWWDYNTIPRKCPIWCACQKPPATTRDGVKQKGHTQGVKSSTESMARTWQVKGIMKTKRMITKKHASSTQMATTYCTSNSFEMICFNYAQIWNIFRENSKMY